MPLSITARCADTGRLGIAMAGHDANVGPARSSLVERGVGAVVAHASTPRGVSRHLLSLLRGGIYPARALDIALAAARDRERLQLNVVDSRGRAAAFTGRHLLEWRGHRLGRGWAAAGNLLAREWVVEEMGAAFESNAHLALDERLVTALEAGVAAGGDRRGHRSAYVCVAAADATGDLDLRVQAHANPIAELRLLLDGLRDRRHDRTEVTPRLLTVVRT